MEQRSRVYGTLSTVDVTFEIDLLLALAPLLVVPLGLTLFRWTDPGAERLRGLAARAAPFAAVGAGFSVVPAGAAYQQHIGAVLAAAWLAVCVVLAISALAEMAKARPWAVEAYLPIIACVYLAVGAVWLILFRADVTPADWPPVVVQLMAVHFHYVGFGALILAAQASRWLRALPGRWDRLAAFSGVGVAVGMAMYLTGTAVSPLVRVEGTVLMGIALVAVAAGTTLIAFRLRPVARILLLVSSASVWAAMALAVYYGLGRYTETVALGVNQMARIHGVLAALGFTFCGLAGWRMAERTTKLVPPSPPEGPEDPADPAE